MKQLLLYTIIIITLLTSCKSSQPYYYYSIEPELVTSTSEDDLAITELPYDDLTIRTAFAGYGPDYAIFQIEIENEADDYIGISHDDVKLITVDDRQINPHNKYQFIKKLRSEKKQIIKDKKGSTIGNILFAGLETLAFIGTGDGVGAAIYGAESAAFVISDRKSYDLASGDIESEINYIEDWVLYESVVDANSIFTTDVIFPNQDLTTDFDLVIMLEGEEYRIPYDSVLRSGER